MASFVGSILAIVFCFLLEFWKPPWRHVDHFSAQNEGTLWVFPLVFLGPMSFFCFFAVPTSIARKMSRTALASRGFWARFWNVLGFILEVSGDYLANFPCQFSFQFFKLLALIVSIMLALLR